MEPLSGRYFFQINRPYILMTDLHELCMSNGLATDITEVQYYSAIEG